MRNIKPNTSTCRKPCSGLIVTSFSKSEQRQDMGNLFSLLEAYDKYKKITESPSVNGTVEVIK